MSYAYDLITDIKRLGRELVDKLTTKDVAEAIEEELLRARTLRAPHTLEPNIVLHALRRSNMLLAYGLSDEDVEQLVRDYARYGRRSS